MEKIFTEDYCLNFGEYFIIDDTNHQEMFSRQFDRMAIASLDGIQLSDGLLNYVFRPN
jgi:hypothetical protein